MGNTWEKRYYLPGDESEIQELFKFVFKREMGKTESKEHWDWEFLKNPSGLGEILLAVDKDKIVGHYAVIPERIKIKGIPSVGTLSLDTMVHPDYQGQRIFTKLATSLYEDIGKKGMPITYGFPNQNSIHGIVNKLEWKEIATLPVLQLTISAEKVITKALGSKLLGKAGSLFLGKKRLIDQVFDQGSSGMEIALIRDSRYLNWRYIEKPENDYVCFSISGKEQKYGYIVLKIEEKFDFNSAFIVDYFSRGDEPSLDRHLISWATDFLNYKDTDIIVVVMFPHIAYYKIFRKLGYIRVPKRFFPKDIYFCARKNTDDIDFDLIRDSRNWYLTWGDTDVV
jgi:GNAT superfamily N-acetyltransferase